MNLRNMIIFTAVVLLLVVGKLVITARQKPVAAVPDPPSLVRGNTNAPKDATKDTKTNEVLKSQDLEKTASCAAGRKNLESLQIPFGLYAKMVRGQTAPIFSIEDDECVNRNKVYPAEVIRRDGKSGLIFFREKIGDVRVTNIRMVPYKILSQETQGLDRAQLGRMVKRFKQTIGRNNPEDDLKARNEALFESQVLVLKLRLEDKNAALPTYAAPLQHPQAKLVTAQAGKTSFSSFNVYDVRPSQHFKLGAINEAIHLDSGNYDILNLAILPPDALLRKGVDLEVDKLPKNKEAPILIYSNGPYDFSSYNAVTLIAEMGYKQISWLRGGYDDWKGVNYKITLPANITAIDATQALTLLRQNAKFIDARNPNQFRANTISGAANISLRADVDKRGRPEYQPTVITYDGLLNAKEAMAAAPTYAKDQTIVVFGKTEYDIRPVKLAVNLNYYGYRKVYLLKGGYMEWAYYNQLLPNEYPVTESQKPLPKARGQKGGARGKK